MANQSSNIPAAVMNETVVQRPAVSAPLRPPQEHVRAAILALHQWGGVAYYGCLLANAIGQCLPTLVIISKDMEGFRFDPRLKVEIIEKDKIGPMPNPLAYRRILRLVKHDNPDLVHDTSGNACKWSAGLWPLLRRRWPLMITEHDPRPHAGMGSAFATLTRHIAWRCADHLIVHGEKCRQTLLDAGIQKDRISTNRHGIFSIYDQRRHTSVTEEENSILFFGELRPNKGIYRLSAIVRKVHALFPAARFIVAGKRTKLPARREAEKVRSAVELLKSTPGVEVHERYVGDDEVEYFLRRSALVILPYEEASQSGVIPLAYAFGKPVVAFEVGDLGESIVEGETGVLVHAGDDDAFAREIVGLLANDAKRRAMGREAYAWAQTELSWETIARRTIHDYHQLLSRLHTERAHGKEV